MSDLISKSVVIKALEEKSEECKEKGFFHEKKRDKYLSDIQFAKSMAYLEAIEIIKKDGGIE